MKRLLILGSWCLIDACRVAFVFVGHARSFARPAVHESIRLNLIDAFACEADVFWMLADEPLNATTSPASALALERLFRPTRVAVHNASEHAPGACAPPPARSPAELISLGVDPRFKFIEDPLEAVRNAAAQFGRLRAAFRLVRDHERARGREFDWVVRARFDAGWYSTIAPAASFRNDRIYVPIHTWNGVSDQLAIVPRHLAHAYFDAATVVERCVAALDGGTGGTDAWPAWYTPSLLWQPESILWRHLELEGVRFARHTFPAALVRHGGASAGESFTQCTELQPYMLLATFLDAATTTQPTLSAPSVACKSLLKAVHVSACAARFPCCRVALPLDDLRTLALHAVPGRARAPLLKVCDENGLDATLCERMGAELEAQAGVVLDDSFIDDSFSTLALSTLEARLSAAGALPARVDVVIENHAQASEGSGNPRPFVLTLSTSGAELRELWGAVLCECMRLAPALELLAGASARWAPLLREDCVGAQQRLHDTELAIHQQFDDSAATWAEHASFAGEPWLAAIRVAS